MSEPWVQKPSIGRIVLYKLTSDQAVQVNRRRTIGNNASEGDVLPLTIVRVWPNEFGEGIPGVNGQALLDGNDALWVTSAREGDDVGQWSWPPRVTSSVA